MNPVGLLPIDKPEGPSSHDMVDAVRRALGVRRVGHTGTLDPFASGLLILCIGWATRLAEYVAGLPKVYRAVLRLGERTDTDDRTGAVVERSDAWRALDEARLRAALETQVGALEQLPPVYSAKKVGGRRAHAVARGGGAPELRPGRVTVHRLELCEFVPPDVTVEIECSSGTYVRAIARDVGAALGVGAHLRELRRTRIGRFSVDDALALDPDRDPAPERIAERLLPPEAAVAHLPRVEVEERDAERLGHGRPVAGIEGVGRGAVAVFVEGRVAAIAELGEGGLWPRKVFPR